MMLGRGRSPARTYRVMGYSDPKKAIIDRLAAPPGRLISQSHTSAGRWQSSIRGPGGEDADPDTMQFVKERGGSGRQLHFVRFSTRAGDRRRFVVGVVQQLNGPW